MKKKITLPEDIGKLKDLHCGDIVLLSGRILTARDAAHKRLAALMLMRQPLPVDFDGQCLYYVGPCPAKPGEVIGSCGPTTSGRMDPYAPLLFDEGLVAVIGKGARNDKVLDSMLECGAVYFVATGGAGALISQCVKECRVVAFEELGTEAIHELIVEDLPVIVAVDSEGYNLYESGPAEYKRES